MIESNDGGLYGNRSTGGIFAAKYLPYTGNNILCGAPKTTLATE